MNPTKRTPRSPAPSDENDAAVSGTTPPSLFPDVPVPKRAAVSSLSACPSPRHIGRQRVELVPRVNQTLRDIASVVGLSPRGTMGHLLTDLSQRIRLQRPLADSTPHTADRLPGPDQTMVLRYIPITQTAKHHLHRWTQATGTCASALVTRRILQVEDHLSETDPVDDPLGSYQLLLDVLYERQDDA